MKETGPLSDVRYGNELQTEASTTATGRGKEKNLQNQVIKSEKQFLIIIICGTAGNSSGKCFRQNNESRFLERNVGLSLM